MGFTIAGYEILDKIGSGAVGEVYKGRDPKSKKIVAIKLLNEDLTSNPNAVERFKREIRQAIQLDHPNLVAGYTAGEFKGRRYYVMEFVEGITVEKLLLREGSMDELSSFDIILQIAKAMEYAGTFNIIHRDIKPDNIIVRPDKVAKLCDMGLAKAAESQTRLTAYGTVLGTPHYMSPEQARGDENIDCRTDIFSLGATWYRMLTGSPPFEGADAISILTALLEKEPVAIQERNPRISDNTCTIIYKMMAKNREERHKNFSELLLVLTKLKTEITNPTTPSVNQRGKRQPTFQDCYYPSDVDILVAQIALHNKLVGPAKLEECFHRQESLAMIGIQFDLSNIMLEQRVISLQQKGILDKAVVQVMIDKSDEIFRRHSNILSEEEARKFQQLNKELNKGIAALLVAQNGIDEEKRQKIYAAVRHAFTENETKQILKVAQENNIISQFQIEKSSRIYSNNIVTGKYKDIGSVMLEKDFITMEAYKALLRAVRRSLVTGKPAADYLNEKKVH
jgi:serine/threonine protein kinase